MILPGQEGGRLLLQVTPSREGQIAATGQGRGVSALLILQREDGRSDAGRIERYGNTRYWAVRDRDGSLICLCVHRKGAQEVVRRLQAREKEE